MKFLLFFIISISIFLFIPSCSSNEYPRDENVLLIIVDTLSTDHLGCYGGRKGVSPAVDRLAEEGIQFMNAYSTAPWTQPAVASILTSLYPSNHGVVDLFDVLSDRHTTLVELLKQQDYVTVGIVSHKLLTSKYGFAQGFDYFNQGNVGDHKAITSSGVTYGAIRWIKENSDKKFFLMLHYFDPHYVYQHHPQFNYTRGYTGSLKPGEDIWELRNNRNRMTENDIRFLGDLYDEEISFTDKYIGTLLDYLEESGLDDKTLIIFTADHGEEFMTHGWIGHTRTLYQELVHVPLIIKDPGRLKPKKIDANVSILDLVPTLFDLLGVPYKKQDFDGESFVHYLEKDDLQNTPNLPVFFEVSFGHAGEEDIRKKQKIAFKKGILQENWKLIYDELNDQWELYNIFEDPVETNNLIGDHPDIRKRLEASLKEWSSALDHKKIRSEGKETVTPSKDELEDLKSLGYIQ